jgi:DNA-binding MarR family transcriptional regulator
MGWNFPRHPARDDVIRAPSAEDRRKVLIQLTYRGEKILENLAAVHRRQLERENQKRRPDLNRPW